MAMLWLCRGHGKLNPGHVVAVPCLCPPSARAKMTAALKVSPAPSVSTRVSGGKASECTSSPLGPMASAPSSAQAQISVALGECEVGLGHTMCPSAPRPLSGTPLPWLDVPPQPSQGLGGRLVPEVPGQVLADEHLWERGWGRGQPPASPARWD